MVELPANNDPDDDSTSWFKPEDKVSGEPFEFGTADEQRGDPGKKPPTFEVPSSAASSPASHPATSAKEPPYPFTASATTSASSSQSSRRNPPPGPSSTSSIPLTTVTTPAAPPDPVVIDPSRNDATRRMAAACYHDQNAMRHVLDLIGSRNFGFIPRHDGVDTNVVVSHAAAAYARWRRHNWITVGATVLAAYAALLTQSGTRPLWDADDEIFLLTREIGPIAAIPGALFMLAYMAVGVLIARWMTAFTRLPRSSMRRTVLIAILVLGWLFAAGQLRFALIFVVAFGIELAQRVHLHVRTLAAFRRETWTGSGGVSPVSLQPLVDGLDNPAGTSNLTVYSGYQPFVAAGFITEEWNSALELRPASGELATEVDGSAFMSEMIKYFKSLGLEQTAVRRWHFIDGEGAARVNELFTSRTSRPASFVSPSTLANHDDELVRPYLWLTSELWRGELVVNSFIRFDVRSKTLFIEVAHAVVPPLRKHYEVCDVELSSQGWIGYSYLARSALDGLMQIVPLMIWRATRRRRWRRSNRAGKARSTILDSIDYGARGSIRDIFAGDVFRHYFQSMDADRMQKTVEVQLLTGLSDSLRAHGYEIAQLDELASSIVTNNITNITGSNIQGENVSVGSNNKVSGFALAAKKSKKG